MRKKERKKEIQKKKSNIRRESQRERGVNKKDIQSKSQIEI